MDSVVRLDLTPSLLLWRIKEALACAVIGFVVSTIVYGITILQAYIYFRNSTRDSLHLRLFVVFIFILDTLSLVLGVDAFYSFIVTDLGNPLMLLNVPHTSAFENGVSVLLRTLTQCFFAYRIWSLSKGKIVLVGTILILALSSCGLGIIVSVHMYTDSSIFSMATVKMRILTGIDNGLSVVCDVMIMISLCYYLHSRRTGFKRTDSIINRLIVYAVNRGALTAICQGGEMITMVTLPGRFMFLPFALAGAKLYCNTLFATLNAQKSLREDGGYVLELNPQVIARTNAARARYVGIAVRSTGATADCEAQSESDRASLDVRQSCTCLDDDPPVVLGHT